MLHAMLKAEGLVQNRKRTYRIYTAPGMQVRAKRRKKLVRPRTPVTVPIRPNERRSMDFVQPGKPTQNAFVESSTRGLAQASDWT